MYDKIYPGRPWLDTDGRRIQAHGGSIIEANGVFYWYGENKEKTVGDPSVSDYVWLPIRFEGDVPVIDWLDSWTPDDY